LLKNSPPPPGPAATCSRGQNVDREDIFSSKKYEMHLHILYVYIYIHIFTYIYILLETRPAPGDVKLVFNVNQIEGRGFTRR
jgi:hypothetical protein